MPPLVPTVFLQASFRGNLVDLHIVVHIVGTGLVLLRDQIDAGESCPRIPTSCALRSSRCIHSVFAVSTPDTAPSRRRAAAF